MNYAINKSISEVEIPYEGHPYIRSSPQIRSVLTGINAFT